jgi:glycosyltransferase involved in cell wall biosynthesis
VASAPDRWQRLRRAAARAAPTIPSWGPSIREGRRIRLVALLACRNEMRFLPEYFANVGPQVDGVIALDDGSTDGSAEYLGGRPEVIELLRVPATRPDWDEPGNFARLVEAALRAGADWAMSLDADDRVEREFRARAERVIRRGRLLGRSGYSIRYRELWDSEATYRVDGIWGGKSPSRLLRVRAGDVVDRQPVHAPKVPRSAGWVPRADLIVYHMRMIAPEDRRARRLRYETLDPDARYQPEGYAYMTDETGIVLRPVPTRRGFSH